MSQSEHDDKRTERSTDDERTNAAALDPYRVLPGGIDGDMKRLQWLNWKNEDARGKVPKRPQTPDKNAKSNDATTWGDFDDALATADDAELGIGLPLAQASPFLAIDIDMPGDGDWVPTFDLGGAVVERSPSGNLRVYLGTSTRPNGGRTRARTDLIPARSSYSTTPAT
jgi:hypothetical protein